jgi:hypothetical protein
MQSPIMEKKAPQAAATARHVPDHETQPPPSLPNLASSTPTGPASMQALDTFIQAYTKIQEVEDDIASIKIDASKVDGAYMQRRKALAHHIDVEIKNRQTEERQTLVLEQKEEVDDLKEKYADLKREQAHQTDVLRQQEKTKLAEVQELWRDLDHKRAGLSKEQLLDFFIAQQGSLKKRKREDSQE